MTYKPPSPVFLGIVNAAHVYAGGLLIYMGHSALNGPFGQIVEGTIMPTHGKLLIGVGVLIVFVGVGGVYFAWKRNKKKMQTHVKLLVAMGVLYLTALTLSGALLISSWISFVWTTVIREQVNNNFGNYICPKALGYYCHTAPNSLVYTDYNQSPQARLVFKSERVFDNQTAILTIPNDPGAPFSQLCVNMEDRLLYLPKSTLAVSFKAACEMCAVVQKYHEFPSLVERDQPGMPTGAIMSVCNNYVFTGNYQTQISFDVTGMSTIVQATIQQHWNTFVGSMATASTLFTVVVALQIYEIQRSLREFRVAMNS